MTTNIQSDNTANTVEQDGGHSEQVAALRQELTAYKVKFAEATMAAAQATEQLSAVFTTLCSELGVDPKGADLNGIFREIQALKHA